jgi:hypothetical protein
LQELQNKDDPIVSSVLFQTSNDATAKFKPQAHSATPVTPELLQLLILPSLGRRKSGESLDESFQARLCFLVDYFSFAIEYVFRVRER